MGAHDRSAHTHRTKRALLRLALLRRNAHICHDLYLPTTLGNSITPELGRRGLHSAAHEE